MNGCKESVHQGLVHFYDIFPGDGHPAFFMASLFPFFMI
jgi:hypothetical protein